MVQKINRRQAQANAARQNQERATTIVDNQLKEGVVTPKNGTALNELQDIAQGNTTAQTAQVNDTQARTQRRATVNQTNTQNTLNFDNNNFVASKTLKNEVQQSERDLARLEAQKKLNPDNSEFFDYAIDQENRKLQQKQERQQVEDEVYRGRVNQAQSFRESDTAETKDVKKEENEGQTDDPIKGEAQAQLSAMAASLPPEFQSYAQQYMAIGQQQLQQALASAELRKSQQDAAIRNDFKDDTALIADLAQISDNMFEYASQMAEKDRKRQQERIDREKDQAMEAQAFTHAKQIKEAQSQKKQQILQQTRALALTGGFASGAGNQALLDTEQDMDNMIRDLERSQDIDKTGLLNTFLGAYDEVESRYDGKIAAAVQQYNLDLKDSKAMTRSSLQSRSDRKLAAEGELSKAVEAANKDWSSDAKTLIGQQYEAVQQQKATVAKQRSERIGFLMSGFSSVMSNLEVSNSEQLDGIIKGLEAEGVDTSFINREAPSIYQMNKAQDKYYEKQLDALKNDFTMDANGNIQRNKSGSQNFIDSQTELDLALIAQNAAKGLGSVDERANARKIATEYLLQNDSNAYRSDVLTNARMTLKKQGVEIYNAEQTVYEIDAARKGLKQYEGDSGLWKSLLESNKKIANLSRDPKFGEAAARITLVSSKIRNELSGAAVSDQEAAFLEPMLPDPTKDTFQDSIYKLNALYSNRLAKVKNAYDGILLGGGKSGAYDLLIGEQPISLDSGIDYNAIFSGEAEQDNVFQMLDAIGEPNASITQDFDTPAYSRSQGGLYDESTVKAWAGKHSGIDIAIPEGTNLPALVGGEIIEAGNKGGWGNTVVVKSPDGALHRYSHLKALKVKKGQKVDTGSLIGLSGNTGNSTGAHLDYRIKLNGKYVNPRTYRPSIVS